MKKQEVIIGIVIVLIIVAVGLVLMRDTDTDNSQTQQTTPATQQNDVAPAPTNSQVTEAVATTTLTYTDTGFEEDTIRVAAGTTLTIVNDSSMILEFSSDEHPTHTDNPELNTQSIGPGETTTVTPEQTGTFGFHNHEEDSHEGTIIVE